MHKILALVALLSAVACDADHDGLSNHFEKRLGMDQRSADTDGDGLMDADELSFGSDPFLPDTDGDGLGDRQEFELGTDPVSVDTDGDSYWDGWEVNEGTDPTDATDAIYTGGWPYQPHKEDWTLTADEHRSPGGALPRWVLQDQHGDLLNLYDLADSGDDLVIIYATSWCGPSHRLADRINDAGGCVADAIKSGKLRVITILGPPGRQVPVLQDLKQWEEMHFNPDIPTVLDPDERYLKWGKINAIPYSTHIDLRTMTVSDEIGRDDYSDAWLATYCED